MRKRTVKDLPKIERPREKIFKYGPEKLKDEELLAIILRVGTKKENVVKLSRKILKKYPPAIIPFTSIEELINYPGLGPAKASQIVALFELGKRFLKNKKSKIYLSPQDIFNELKDIRENKKEHFIAFYLDARNQEIKREVISIGTVNSALVHPREVFEPAVKNIASQIVIAHNHPSENHFPSFEDKEITKKLVEAGKILGIEIADHLIVTKSSYYSFKENNLL